MALAKVNKKDVKTDFNLSLPKKKANYINQEYALRRELAEILTCTRKV